MAEQAHSERARDKSLADSFPASDPPADSGTTGAEVPAKPPNERGIEEIPTGTPNADRHGAETAHQWENETRPQPER